MKSLALFASIGVLVAACGTSPDPADPTTWPVVYDSNEMWARDSLSGLTCTDAKAWRMLEDDEVPVLELHGKSKYKPPVRSPLNVALIDTHAFSDFHLSLEMLQTGRDYNHRDLCLFFGFEQPDHYYYVHMATKADNNAHNVFVVDEAPRQRFATVLTQGVEWGKQQWHRVDLIRRGGTIQVSFDGEPIMRGEERRFPTGYLGFGSFDDTGRFRRVRITAPGVPGSPPPSPKFD